jgi:hypothetical protein
MADQMSKADLTVLVRRIMAADGSETDLDRMVALLSANVPHPAVSDLIYHPGGSELSAEQIVELALTHQPTVLSNTGPAPS